MLKQLNVSVLMLSMICIAHADVLLKTKSEINVQAVNGVEVKKNLFGANKNEYILKEGVNTFQVQYNQYFDAENGIGAHDIVKSSSVVIKTPILQNNQIYTLALINPPKNNDEAKQFAKQPKFTLYNSQNEILMTQVRENDKKAIINLNAQKNVDEQSQYIELAESSDALNKLVNTWNNASKEDKQQFMLWIVEHAN